MAPKSLLDSAIEHHRAGRFAAAETAYAHVLAAEPDNPDALHLLGVLYHQTDRSQAAPGLIRQALARRTPFPTAWNSLGNVLAATGAHAAAEQALRQALALDPGYVEAHTNLGALLERTGRDAAASACYRRALAHAPNHAGAHYNLGQVLRRSGHLDAAVARLSAAFQLTPRDAGIGTALAQVLRDLNRPADAQTVVQRVLAARPGHPDALLTLASLRNAQGDAAGTEAALTAVLRQRPDRLDALRPLTLLRSGQGRWVEAEPLLRRLLAVEPADPAGLSAQAEGLSALGRSAEALPWWRRVHSLSPADAGVAAALGQAALAAGRPEEAAAACTTALARAPTLARASLGLATSLLDLQRDRDTALAHARRAVLALPARPAALVTWGRALAWTGAAREAATWYRRALRVHPEDAGAHRCLGLLLAKRPDTRADAIHHLEAAIRLAPSHPDPYPALAELFLEANQADQADRTLRSGLTASADPDDAACTLAAFLILRGRLSEAQAVLDPVQARNPDYPPLHIQLAQLAWRRGQTVAALDHVGTALRLNPKQPAARLQRALILLGRGALLVGWRDYTWRFSAKGARDRAIGRPRWRGAPGAELRLLVWREQGIGDELMFGTCYPELAGVVGTAIVEAEPRLVPLLARSLPGVQVRTERIDAAGHETAATDCDVHTPAGDLPLLLRPSLASFPGRAGWLVPDPARTASWQARLDALGTGLKVGVCWRSQLVSSYRAAAYTNLSDWQPILATPFCRFVNLQSDADQAERARLTGWDGLDLRDDLEGLAALIARLDLVISASTAISELAGALGVPVWRITLPHDWTCLGTAVRPWFPSMRVLPVRPGAGVGAALAEAARHLRRLAIRAHDRPAQAYAPATTTMPGPGAALGTPPFITPAPAATGALAERHAARLVAARRYPEADAAYRQALTARPDDVALWHGFAVNLERLGRDEDAASAYRQALAHAAETGAPAGGAGGVAAAGVTAVPNRPSLGVTFGNLGNCLLRLGRAEAALACHRRALALEPPAAAAHLNLGSTLLALDRPAEAAASHGRGVTLAPEQASAHSNLGAALDRLGRSAEAEACYRAALARDPEQPDALCNLGFLSFTRRAYADAERLYLAALAHRPDFALARYNLALLLLRTGRLTEGWDAHEARFDAPVLRNPHRTFGLPAWDGRPDPDLSLLVVHEQGLGDELLFATLYADAAERVGRLVLCCDERLTGLLSRRFATARLLPEPPLRPRRLLPAETAAQAHSAAGSLCRPLRPRLSAFPLAPPGAVPTPLLTPLPERLTAARTWLDGLDPGLRVGLCWRSSLQTSLRRQASTELTDWLDLLRLPGLCVVSIQYDDDTAERTALAESHAVTLPRWPGVDLRTDLESAAALAASLDLVVSTGTAAAELAAAVGTPVWRLEDDNAWTLLGTRCRPFFPQVQVFPIRPGESPATAAGRLARALRRALRPAYPSASASTPR